MLLLVMDLVVLVQVLLMTWFVLDGMGSWICAAVITGGFLVLTGYAVWVHDQALTGVGLALVIVWAVDTWLTWKNRKNRRRKSLLSKLGYKGRAIRQKLVKGMPKPRAPRVKVPVPSPG